jgi:hypothetical protein
VLLAGRWAWWNNYGNVPIAQCVQRAKAAQLDGVIVKQGFDNERNHFATAGVPWATERYVYPDQAQAEGRRLAGDIARGARFAVINAEAEWETLDSAPMLALIAALRAAAPTTEIYGCVDTRGNRTELPYQRALAQHATAVIPMIYPKAFQQPVALAFSAALDNHNFRGLPTLPAIQTYDNIGAQSVADQLAEVRRRRLPGYQAYTIAHATTDEWAVIAADAAPSPAERLAALNAVGDIFAACALHGLRGEQLPPMLKGRAKYLLQ